MVARHRMHDWVKDAPGVVVGPGALVLAELAVVVLIVTQNQYVIGILRGRQRCRRRLLAAVGVIPGNFFFK